MRTTFSEVIMMFGLKISRDLQEFFRLFVEQEEVPKLTMDDEEGRH